MQYQVAIQDRKYVVEIGAVVDGCVAVTVNDAVFHVTVEDPTGVPETAPAPQPAAVAAPASAPPPRAASPRVPPPATAAAGPPKAASGNGAVTAPIPGLIIDLKAAVGDTVAAGQTVAVMEAMKMENNISSPKDGKVLEVRVAKGATVADGDVIMVIG